MGREEILCYFDQGDFGWCETATEEGEEFDYDYEVSCHQAVMQAVTAVMLYYEAVPWGYCSFHCHLPYTKYGHSLFGTDVRYLLTTQRFY